MTLLVIVGAVAYFGGLWVGAMTAWISAGRTWYEFWHRGTHLALR